MNPITIPNISIPTIGIPTIGIPSVGFPSASGGGGLVWPAGMKEHIKAWYDPKKQGMTNFDVIEAYMEDFTTWTVNKEGVIANVTSKSITITNVLNSNPLIYAYDTFSVRLRIDGLKDNQGIFFGDNKEYTISENGIYDIDTTENIRTNFIGECNITITQLPTSILKDLSGNGNHAYLYGGKGKLNSGMGVYKEDFTTWNYVPERGDVTRSYNTIHITKVTNTVTANIISKTNEFGNSITLKIVGATYDNPLMVGTYSKPNGYTAISKDGVYSFEIDEQYWGFRFNKDGDVNVTITQIPDYPDQLCYDGKMYAVAYDMPILTDYTVMAERAILDNSDIADWAFIAKRDYPAINGAFTFEKDIDDTSDNLRTISFGCTSVIYNPIKERSISYQTKNKYNGQDIIVGNVDDVDFLLIGAGILDTNLNLVKEKMRVAHGAIIVADRSFTEEEINWLKQNWDKI